MLQILSITGDNASNNDTMIQYLGNALDKLPSPTNQMQCFAHTINLIAKSILKPFDIQRMKDIHEFNDVAQALADTFEEGVIEKEDEEEDDDDDDEINTSLGPIKLMLLKVYLCIINPNPKQLTNVE
jgi:hypothetical protein